MSAPEQATARWPRYRSYRDAQSRWLDEIPSGWGLRRMKYVASVNPSWLPSRVTRDTEVSFVPMERVQEGGGLDLSETRLAEDVGSGHTWFADGDVLVAKITPCFENRKGALCSGLANGMGAGTTEFYVLRPGDDVDGRFLLHLTMSEVFRRGGAAEMYGAAGQKRVPTGFVNDFTVPLPPLSEQRAIAEFLDRETGRIDALIEKMRRLIELLEEKRAALITRAVTRGLDPTVPLKPSGVEWLGDIPEHWEVLPLKRVTVRIQTGSTPPTKEQAYYADADIPWYTPDDFGSHVELEDSSRSINSIALADGAAPLFAAGSVLMVCIGASTGKSGLLSHPGASNQQITCMTVDAERVVPRYAAYQMKHMEVTVNSIAPRTTLPIMSATRVGYLPFLVPPRDEQAAISEHIEGVSAGFASMTQRVRAAIATLQEYRTALISAAVTGKIDVRGSR